MTLAAATETWCHQATCDDRGFWLIVFPIGMAVVGVGSWLISRLYP